MNRLNLLMLVALIGCALGLITSQHQSRKLFIAIEGEQATAQKLAEEWTQLQLEQGTWGTHKRVEAVASRQLGMKLPDPPSTVVLKVEAR